MSEEAEGFFGLSVTDDRRVDHQITEEQIILCDQEEKLIYTAMKKMMPTYADGKEDHLYLVPPRNKLFLQKIAHLPSMPLFIQLQTLIMYLVYMLILITQTFMTHYLINL